MDCNFFSKKHNINDVVPLHIYVLKFDGCSKGNPGPSGAGAVLYKNNEEIWSNSIYVGDNQTNNYAEYSGLVLGLNQVVNMSIKNISILGDSEIVIKQMKGLYKVKSANLLDLYNVSKRLSRHFDSVEYIHIAREYNKRADELANYGLTKKNIR